jgi:hypothetical protein
MNEPLNQLLWKDPLSLIPGSSFAADDRPIDVARNATAAAQVAQQHTRILPIWLVNLQRAQRKPSDTDFLLPANQSREAES